MSEQTQLSFSDKVRSLEIEGLIKNRDELVARLDDGSDKIEEAILQGKDVTNWESHWIGLLRQYEAVCDKLKEFEGLR
jgi:hypothetical protein